MIFTLFTITSVIPAVGRTSVYDWRHEESLDPHEDINQYVLARIYIFSRLTSASVIIARIKDDTHEKDSNTGKDCSCDGDRIAGSDLT